MGSSKVQKEVVVPGERPTVGKRYCIWTADGPQEYIVNEVVERVRLPSVFDSLRRPIRVPGWKIRYTEVKPRW